MFQWLFAVACLAAASAHVPTAARAQEAVSSTPAADAWVRAFTKREHDFGRVHAGDRVRHAFPLTNSGPHPLAIASVRASCSCVELGDWPERLAPGESGSIPVLLHTANYFGPVQETLTVTGTDPAHPPVTLRLRADAWRPIEVQPASVVFEWFPQDPGDSLGTVRILNRGEAPLELSPPTSRQPGLAADLIPVVPGREFELRVRRVPPFQRGNLYGSLTLQTSLDSMPVLEVPVHSLVAAAVSVTPRSLVFPADLHAGASRSLVVRHNGDGLLRLKTPPPPVPGSRVMIDEFIPGKKFRVTVEIPPGTAGSIPGGSVLMLETDHPTLPKLQVPIRDDVTGKPDPR